MYSIYVEASRSPGCAACQFNEKQTGQLPALSQTGSNRDACGMQLVFRPKIRSQCLGQAGGSAAAEEYAETLNCHCNLVSRPSFMVARRCYRPPKSRTLDICYGLNCSYQWQIKSANS